VIGEIFDRVHIEAGSAINENVQTTLVPAGGAAIVEFAVEVPGELILVDHSIFRAFNKGALAKISVQGEEDETLYSGTQRQEVYLLEGGVAQEMPEAQRPSQVAATVEEQIELGRNLYMHTCAACHMPEGTGVPGAFPPLAASDYLNADAARAIRVVAQGISGEITVNGQVYNNVMPRLNLRADEIANVLTYVYSQWGNDGSVVGVEEVQRELEGG
jgi:nitrite reductase (NO-forming)